MGWRDRRRRGEGNRMDRQPPRWRQEPKSATRGERERTTDCGASGTRQIQTMAVPVYHAGLASEKTGGTVWTAMEYRNRSAFVEANRAPSSPACQDHEDAPKGTVD